MIKLIRKASIVLTLSAATFAVAQITPGTFKHIIIVVQENRTPDNLFGSSPGIQSVCGQENNPAISGADIDNGGYNNTTNQLTCNMQLPLNGWDAEWVPAPHGGLNQIGIISPDHFYEGWGADFDYHDGAGHMDGFCHQYGNLTWPHPCPSYSYVAAGDVQPYFSIAQNYGFANYMFQSNEGASYTAHQFLFTGTSAPVAPGQNHSLDFVADYTSVGCEHSGRGPDWALPDGSEIVDPLNSTCYAHDTLVTAATACNPLTLHCDRPEVPSSGWGYYGPSSYSQWNAPLANPQTCYGKKDPQGGPCSTTPHTEYVDHVHLPGSPTPWNPTRTYSDAPIFDDLYGCQLPAISWVVPDGRWSDHTLSTDTAQSLALGPDWVGDIINAVGNGVGQACNGKYWTTEPTAVIVTWDDWGGWYDHIKPWAYYRGTCDQNEQNCKCPPGQPPQGAPNGWGCGYVAGFRVPLLVVSAYTGQSDGKGGVTGWVSGTCGTGEPNQCPFFGPPTNPLEFVHDFGSILGFTEWNFGMKFIDQSGDNGYADLNAPDWSPDHKTTPPLADFFQLPLNQPRSFVSVTTKYDYTCFQQIGKCFGSAPYQPEDPDDY
jgi:phospholipase C